MTNQLSAAFNECSAEIKNLMSSQPEVKAEMLTGWLLNNLPKKIPSIKSKQFTHSAEMNIPPADWEWWFVFSNGNSFAVRIVAKKLEASIDHYNELGSPINGKSQVEQLIEDNAKEGFASMYVLYSTNEQNSSICKNAKSNDGVFWCEANKLLNGFFMNGPRALSPSEILAISNPVSCAFSCPGIYGESMDIEQGFRQHIGHYFPYLSGENNGGTGFRDTPAYIINLLESENNPGGWEMQQHPYPEKSKAILAVDLR